MSGLVEYYGSDDDESDQESEQGPLLVSYNDESQEHTAENHSDHEDAQQSSADKQQGSVVRLEQRSRPPSVSSMAGKVAPAIGRAVLLSAVKGRSSPLIVQRNPSSPGVARSPFMAPSALSLPSPAYTPASAVEMANPPTTSDSNPNIDLSRLPPTPRGAIAPEVLAKVQKMLHYKRLGKDINSMITTNHKFRNPSIYEQLIQQMRITETGSNFPKDVYDPTRWTSADYYEELREAQNVYIEKKARARAQRTEIAFNAATAPDAAVKRTASDASQPAKRSKWESGTLPSSGSLLPQPTITGAAPPVPAQSQPQPTAIKQEALAAVERARMLAENMRQRALGQQPK